MTCELCKRDVELTEHHLIPREMHNKKWCHKMFSLEERKNKKIDICHDCHAAIHFFISNKELGQIYHSIEKLTTHEDLMNFINWVSKDTRRKFKF